MPLNFIICEAEDFTNLEKMKKFVTHHKSCRPQTRLTHSNWERTQRVINMFQYNFHIQYLNHDWYHDFHSLVSTCQSILQ